MSFLRAASHKELCGGSGLSAKAYAFIQNQVAMGHQAYLICPMVEASEMIEAENVLDYTKSLQKELSLRDSVEYFTAR